MTDPTAEAVEAMAERLWDLWEMHVHGGRTRWADVLEIAGRGGYYKRQANAFRAMAREALRTEPGVDEVRG